MLSSPDKSVRIPVNIGDGGATAVSRFIEAFGGGGVQQIAFATGDLFGFVEKAKAAGVEFLSIPDNYYEDLSARYDLESGLLERMRALGVLYDRTKGGEFFHIYTKMFDDRFFFEILERRNYDLLRGGQHACAACRAGDRDGRVGQGAGRLRELIGSGGPALLMQRAPEGFPSRRRETARRRGCS